MVQTRHTKSYARLPAFLVALTLLLGLNAAARADEIIIQHSGNTDPATEGFTVVSGSGGSDAATTPPSWGMIDAVTNNDARRIYPGTAPINNIMTPAELAQMAVDGWTMSWVVEVVSASFGDTDRLVESSMSVNIGGTNYRYILRLGRTPTATGANLQVRVVDDAGTPDQIFVGQGAGFHRFDLVAPAGSNVASFYFDGVLIPALTTNGLAGNVANTYFGSVDDPNTGGGNWNLVQFAIPEPASASLAAIGGLLCLHRRARARR